MAVSLPKLVFTDGMPLNYALTGTGGVTVSGSAATEFNVEVGSGGVSIGGAATYEYWPYEHTIEGGVTIAGSAANPIMTYSIVGAGGAAVGGVFAIEVDLVDAGNMDASLPSPMTSDFSCYTEVNNLTASIFRPLVLNATATMGSSVASFAPSLPKLQATLVKAATLAGSLPALTGSLTADYITTGALAGRLPKTLRAASWDASASVTGALVGRAHRLTGAFTAYSGHLGALAGALPKVSGSLSAYAGVLGTLAASTPALTGALTAFLGSVGALDGRLTRLTGLFAPVVSTTYLTTFVTNLANNVLTSFSNYDFNSVAKLDGVFLAAKSDGIYVLDGADDQGTAIASVVELGNHDFGIRDQKRVSDFYMAYNTSGKMQVVVSTDETAAYTYTMEDYGVETIKQRRVPLGKGMRGKYWKVVLKNVEGADFRVESLHLRVAPQTRMV